MDATVVRLFESAYDALGPVQGLRDQLAALFHPFALAQGENIESRVQSAKFVQSLPRGVKRLALRGQIQEWCADRCGAEGLFLEFGVAEGQSASRIASVMNRRGIASALYAFDSFLGLPEDWRKGIEAGTFARHGPPSLPKNVELVVGLFQESLKPFLESHRGVASFVHVDSDLYSSAAYVLDTLLADDRLADGTVVLFDEFYNYPGWRRSGEFLALSERLPRPGLDFRVIAIVPFNQQVAIRIIRG